MKTNPYSIKGLHQRFPEGPPIGVPAGTLCPRCGQGKLLDESDYNKSKGATSYCPSCHWIF